jgi:hypothetical protein
MRCTRSPNALIHTPTLPPHADNHFTSSISRVINSSRAINPSSGSPGSSGGSGSSGGGLGTGAIIGIAVGGAVALTLIIVLSVLAFRAKSNQGDRSSQAASSLPWGGYKGGSEAGTLPSYLAPGTPSHSGMYAGASQPHSLAPSSLHYHAGYLAPLGGPPGSAYASSQAGASGQGLQTSMTSLSVGSGMGMGAESPPVAQARI